MARTYIKDPEAVLDYKFDWSSWLDSGETIASRTVTVDTGLTKDSDAVTDTSTSVTVWLSGGTDGVSYSVNCQIVTSANRTDERTMIIRVNER